MTTRIVPPRPQTGLVAGTRIMVLGGHLPVERLRPGERVVTRQGVRPLRAVQITERAVAGAVSIGASALGHGRPATGLTVAAAQPLLIRDWRAPALFGEMLALVPASRLADGIHVVRHAARALRTYVLVFDTPQIVYAEGAEFAMTRTVDEIA